MRSYAALRSAPLILMAIMGAMCAPAMTSAQSPISVSVSPLVGAGNFRGQAEMIPSTISTNSRLNLDAVGYFGLQMEATHAGFPLSLRLGGARTFGGYLRAQQGSRKTFLRTETVYGSVGDAAVTFLWTDVRFAPFHWKVRPYAYLGTSYRWASLSPRTSEIEGLIAGSKDRVQGRWGYGLEFDTFGDRSLWIEVAKPLGVDPPPQRDTPQPGWQSRSVGPSIALGLKLFSF